MPFTTSDTELKVFNAHHATPALMFISDANTFRPATSSDFQGSTQTNATSAGNTTTDLLSGNSWYTGSWEQNTFADVMVSCYANKSGNLYFDFSNDGTTVNTFPVAGFQVASGIHEFHTAVKGPRYFRVRYHNKSSDPQGDFFVYTYYGVFRQPNTPLNGSLSLDADSIATKPIPFDLQVVRGLVAGITLNTKYGRNPDIDTATDPEDVINVGGLYSGQPTTGSASTMTIFSSSSSDSSGGGGATGLKLYGLDWNYNYQTEDLPISGTSLVAGTKTWKRCNRIRILGAGSAGHNVGTITARWTSNNQNIFASVPAKANRSQICAYTVPAGKTVYIKKIGLSLNRGNGSTGSANIYLLIREFGGVYERRRTYSLGSAGINQLELDITVPEKSDILVRVDQVSANDTDVSAELQYFEIDTSVF